MPFLLFRALPMSRKSSSVKSASDVDSSVKTFRNGLLAIMPDSHPLFNAIIGLHNDFPRKTAVKASSKTPLGLTNIRTCVMQLLGSLKSVIPSELLDTFYSNAGGTRSDGPMKISSKIIQDFADHPDIYSFWSSVSADYTAKGIKRGEALDFWLLSLPQFLASLIILYSKDSSLAFKGDSLKSLAKLSFAKLVSKCSNLNVSASSAKSQCSYRLKNKAQCKRNAKSGCDFCTQHQNITNKSASASATAIVAHASTADDSDADLSLSD